MSTAPQKSLRKVILKCLKRGYGAAEGAGESSNTQGENQGDIVEEKSKKGTKEEALFGSVVSALKKVEGERFDEPTIKSRFKAELESLVACQKVTCGASLTDKSHANDKIYSVAEAPAGEKRPPAPSKTKNQKKKEKKRKLKEKKKAKLQQQANSGEGEDAVKNQGNKDSADDGNEQTDQEDSDPMDLDEGRLPVSDDAMATEAGVVVIDENDDFIPTKRDKKGKEKKEKKEKDKKRKLEASSGSSSADGVVGELDDHGSAGVGKKDKRATSPTEAAAINELEDNRKAKKSKRDKDTPAAGAAIDSAKEPNSGSLFSASTTTTSSSSGSSGSSHSAKMITDAAKDGDGSAARTGGDSAEEEGNKAGIPVAAATEKQEETAADTNSKISHETKHVDKEKKKEQGKARAKTKGQASSSSEFVELWRNGERYWREGLFTEEYLRSNPDRVTRLFCGNLNKKVTEEELRKCISGITYIKWITDRETGEFYGSSFIEVADPDSAIRAVLQDKSKFMGRPLKLYYCPPRPGDVWPPVGDGAHGAGARGGEKSNNPPRRERTPKPEGCRKLYMGNLSYNVDDETVTHFFKDCGQMMGLRWLTHKNSGEFRGSGYVEFSSTEEAEAALLLDGKELLGRPIKLDWTT